jgi:hypothetical protein
VLILPLTARSFLRLGNLLNCALDRLSRYEATLLALHWPKSCLRSMAGTPQTTRKAAAFRS